MEESSQDNTRLLEEQSDHATPHTADIDQSTSSLDPRAELHILSSEHRHLGYYDASAKSPFPIRSAQRRMEDRMIDTLSLHASQWVLNVGCGSGLTACRLVEEANLTVIAIDTDPKHVKETIKNIARQYVGARMIVSEANYQNLRYEDNSFDGVCGLECFGYATDPSLAIREFARVLNPGGRLVLHTVIEVVSRESENEPHHGMASSMLMDSLALLYDNLSPLLPFSYPIAINYPKSPSSCSFSLISHPLHNNTNNNSRILHVPPCSRLLFLPNRIQHLHPPQAV